MILIADFTRENDFCPNAPWAPHKKNDFFLWAPQNASQMKVTFKIKWFFFFAQMILECLTKQRKFAFFAWNLQRFRLQRTIAKMTFAIVFCKNSLDAWSFSPERENSCRTQSRKSLLRLCSAIQIVADFTQKIILFCEAFWGAYKKKIILLCETLKGLLGGKSRTCEQRRVLLHTPHTQKPEFSGALTKKYDFCCETLNCRYPEKSMTSCEKNPWRGQSAIMTNRDTIRLLTSLRSTTLSDFAYRLHSRTSLTDYITLSLNKIRLPTILSDFEPKIPECSRSLFQISAPNNTTRQTGPAVGLRSV